MNNNLDLLIPEILVGSLAFIILGLDLFLKPKFKEYIAYIASAGLILIFMFSIIPIWNTKANIYGDILVLDGYAVFFKSIFLILGAILILSSKSYVSNYFSYIAEYYSIVIFSILAMMFMVSSAEILTAYISLELLSFSLYVLVAFNRFSNRANEASIKYILLGAFSSAILLYGVSQIYGHLGTTNLTQIQKELSVNSEMSLGLIIGFSMFIVGFLFKIGIVPFHMWVPDVYEGSSTPVTAYLAVLVKVAVIALFIRVLVVGLIPIAQDWQLILIGFSIVSMVLGNVVALIQSNIKRLLAYSSIGHAGYILLGLAAIGTLDQKGLIIVDFSRLIVNGIILHLISYSLASIAIFLCVDIIFGNSDDEQIDIMRGLNARSPLMSLLITASLISLGGLPIFVGFTSKFYLFNAIGTQISLWYVGIAIITSLISLYYYLHVIRKIYIDNNEDQIAISLPILTKSILVFLLFALVFLGIYPNILMEFIYHASESLL